MANFKVKTQDIRSESDQLKQYAGKVDDVKNTTDAVLTRLASITTVGKNIQSKLRSEISKVQSESDKLRIYANTLTEIAALYEECEGKLSGVEETNLQINQLASEAAQALKDIKETFGNDPSSQYSSDPVNLSTGNYIYECTDIQLDGYAPLVFKRFYNAQDDIQHALGIGMLHNYEVALTKNVREAANADLAVSMEDGHWQYFVRDEDGAYHGIHGGTGQLSEYETEDGEIAYRLVEKNQDRYIFNENGQLIRKDENGKAGFRFEYDESGRLSKAVSDSGTYFVYKYEGNFLYELWGQNGRLLVFSYEGGRLSFVLREDGTALRYLYGENHKICEVVDAKKTSVVKNIYDKERRVIRQEFPDGSFMAYEYGDHSVILQERNGSRTTYLHDAQLRNTDILYEDGTKEHFEYNDKNQKVLIQDRNGNIFRASYDKYGNLVKLIDASGRKIHANYGAEGRLLAVSVNGINRLKNTYDAKGNLLVSEGADGSGAVNSYDAFGRLVERVDLDGNRTEISYDDRGNICSLMKDGILTRYVYDAQNRVELSIDGNGNETKYVYDNRNRITHIINAMGDVSIYAYDANGLLTELTDFDGFHLSAKYNALNLQEELIDKEGNSSRFFYDAMWNLQKQVNADGGCAEYIYDKNNRLSCAIAPEGGKTEYAYDGNGNLIARTEADGGVERYAYDASNRLVEKVDPEGNRTRYEYDIFDNLVAETDALGNTTRYEYDENDHRTAFIDALGNTTRFHYTKAGEISMVEYPNGSTQSFRYEHGRISEVCYADGNILHCSYDGNGNLTEAANRIGNKVSFHYDQLNRVTEMILPNGGVRKLNYTKAGKISAYTDENGNTSSYSYSPNGNLTAVLDALGHKTSYEYDGMNRMVSMLRFGEDDVVQKTSYLFDKESHILSVTNPLGICESFDYDLKGRVISRRDGDGFVTRYQYNHNDDITEILYSDHRKADYQYDALRHLQQIQDWNGTTNLQNDALGRILSVTGPHGQTVAYEWGSVSERRKLVYPDGTSIQYHYDARGHLSAMETPDGTTQYAYDECGRICEKILPNGILTKYKFNDLGKLSSLLYQGDGLEERVDFAYDLSGRKITAERQYGESGKLPEKQDFSYDALNRLTGVALNGKMTREYHYDAFGNRIRKIDFQDGSTSEYVYDLNNALTGEFSAGRKLTYTYDQRGNLHHVIENGQRVKNFSFDSAENLCKITIKNGGNIRLGTYQYDSFGHRIGEEITEGFISFDLNEEEFPALPRDAYKTTRYTLDLTKDHNNLLARETAGKVQSYFWDNVILGLRDGNGSAYYLHDDLGSVRHLTGADAGILSSYLFDEFGNSGFAESDFERQIFGYTAYQLDSLPGLWYAQARRYDAAAGRFISQDMLPGDTSLPYSLNRYTYCYNEPEDYVDQDGRFAILATLAVVAGGAVISGLVSGGINAAGQLVERQLQKMQGKQPEPFKWGDFWGSVAQGAITGGVAAIPGLGPVASVAVAAAGGAAGGAAHSMISQKIDEGQVDMGRVGKEALIGGVTAGISKGFDNLVVDKVKDKVANWGVQKYGPTFNSSRLGKYLNSESVDDVAKHFVSGWGILTNRSMWNLYGQFAKKSFFDALKDSASDFTDKTGIKDWFKGKSEDGYGNLSDALFPEPKAVCGLSW